jgi:proline iminopeptidase
VSAPAAARWLLVAAVFAGCRPGDSAPDAGGRDSVDAASDSRAGAGSGAAPAVRERFITTPDGVRLFVREVGEGAETVIAPFVQFHTDRLDPLARGRRLVLYDPRGRGRSDAVDPSRVSLEYQLSDLEAVRSAAGADRAALIGWSGMGMELWVYARRHPDRVTRLVQLAPVPPRQEPWMERIMLDREARSDTAALRRAEEATQAGADPAESCRALADLRRQATFADPSDAWEAPDLCDLPNERNENLGPYFEALLGSFGAFDWRGELSSVTVPRLVIHGARDNIPLEGNREWVAGQAHARLLVVPEAGHWPHYERPELVLPAIETFLRGGWPRGAEAVSGHGSPDSAGAAITHVANEGFLLAGGGARVLVDALFRDGLPEYERVTGAEREALETGRGAFADVDAVLVTHVHRDHFHPLAVARHLESNPRTVVLGPAQVADSLELHAPRWAAIAGRAIRITPSAGTRLERRVGELEVGGLGLHHPPSRNQPVQHTGWIVRIGGRTILHLGDAALDEREFAPLGLGAAGVDLALVPAWVLDDGGWAFLDRHVKPGRVVAMHVPPEDVASTRERLAAQGRGAVVLAPGESLRF